MGQRRELRKPEGVRKMLADSRRKVGRLRRQLREMSGRLEDGAVQYLQLEGEHKSLQGRFKPILKVGSLILVKDLLRKGKK